MSNEGLKGILSEVFDSIGAIEDIQSHDYFGLIGELAKMLAELPDVAANISDIKAEIRQLPGSQQQEDLISFIETEFESQFPSAKAQSILSTSLNIVKSAINLVEGSFEMKKIFSGSSS